MRYVSCHGPFLYIKVHVLILAYSPFFFLDVTDVQALRIEFVPVHKRKRRLKFSVS